jgi:threonine dehydrogenase-like Zn-dependent dehydrogenase
MAVQAAAASGAGSVTVVEPLAERRALAVGLGADRAVPPGDAAALEVDVASSARGPGRYPASARSVVTTVSAMATRMAVALISPGWHGSPTVRMSRSRLRRAPAGGISPRKLAVAGIADRAGLDMAKTAVPANDVEMAPSAAEPRVQECQIAGFGLSI